MSFLDALADLLLVDRVDGLRRKGAEPKQTKRNGFARGNVRYRQQKIHTKEQLEEERVAFRKSLARTDY
jgi:hypothetical protein